MTTKDIVQKVTPRLLRGLAIGVISSLLLVTVVLAAPNEPAATPNTKTGTDGTQTVQGNDDGGTLEYGIESSADNLRQATAAERAGMSAWLDYWHWIRRYSYNEDSSWEEDFKRPALGGNDNNYADSVDLQFYVGHGWDGGFTFFKDTHDDGSIVPNDCAGAWGDNDNEWMALTSCQVLGDNNLGNWASCLNGTHLMLGFKSLAAAHNDSASTQGYQFGRYMYYGYSVSQAWFKACDVSQRGRTTRVLAEEIACFNDRPGGAVCSDAVDNDYYWQTHDCGTESASYVPLDKLAGEMPVFTVAPYSLAEANRDFTNLGDTFSLPVTPTLQAATLTVDGATFYTSTVNGRTLDMDKNSGLFEFSDLNNLWSSQAISQAMAVNAASTNYINADIAKQIADNFLNSNNLMGTGAAFYQVVSDTVGTGAQGGSGLSAAAVTEAEQPTIWQVIYSRHITSTLVTAAGVHETLDFMVVGPGAKQKVYVPITAGVNAANVLDTQPVGVQGGWRDIGPQINAATGEQVMVAILTPDEIDSLYNKLNDKVAMNDIPMEVKSRTILSHTVAYYENASGVSQGELIPVYELKVHLVEKNTNAESDDFAYVPASPSYMRPFARIDASSVPSSSVASGTEINLTASDASLTLKQLDPTNLSAFNFVMGKGDYLYEWHLGSIDGPIIGNGGRTLKYTVVATSDGKASEQTIYLKVIDVNSPNKTFATDGVSISVAPSIFLPVVLK